VPPARYTEASLIKKLEEEGIGRPSTFEPTIETILRRGYVFRQGKALVPSFTAFAVTDLLRNHFGDYVDVGFTAKMEESLDEISNGERDRTDFIRSFYLGDDHRPGLETEASQGASAADYPVIEIGVDPESGQPIRVRIGRFGPFLQVGEGGPGNTASLPDETAPADLSVEQAMALVRAKAAGPRAVGVDPVTGQTVYAMRGRFGAYVQLGETPEKATKGAKGEKPRRASLPKGVSEEQVTLNEALKLLDLPRTLGTHPETGEPVIANVGRFGPYVKHGDEFRSLEAADDVYAIALDRALQLLAAPKKARRRQAATRTVLAELGPHPETGKPVTILDGRYGPYVTDGTTNASLPKNTAPSNVTLAEATGLLAARVAAGPVVKRGRRAKAPTAKAPASSRRRRPAMAGAGKE
jgi:DNA topoisomerase-1